MSDSTVAGHPLVLDATSTAATSEWAIFTYGTPGNAGAYVDIICKPGATIGATAYYECSSHGRPMSENATINVTAGTAGESGSGAQLDITVVGGAVTAATFSTGMQGDGYAVGDVCLLYTSPSPRDRG